MNTAYIHSRLAADPVLGELVEMFVTEIPNRISALETQARSRNWEQLTRTAHQLKGAAGSYGFDPITPYAARVEQAAKKRHQEEQILLALADLLDLCRRVRAGVPQGDNNRCTAPQSGLPEAITTTD